MRENSEPSELILAEPILDLLPDSVDPANIDLAANYSRFWEKVLTELKNSIDPQIYSGYFESLNLLSVDSLKELFVIGAPSKLVSSQIESSFKSKIIDAITCVTSTYPEELVFKNSSENMNSGQINIQVEVQQRTQPVINKTGQIPSTRFVVVKKVASPSLIEPEIEHINPEVRVAESNINRRYNFGTFVVGSSNQFCHAAALQVAERPGQSYNPLFIYGGVGLGKTHLLHSIGNSVLDRNPSASVLYMSSEAFTNELIQALRHAKMDEFKRRLRTVNVLLIDDIQFIIGKERTQEEFFHTFNALYGAKQQIVITSDRIPSDIPGIEERLQTRFSWGLTADLQAPDFETRVAILKRKAALDKFSLPDDVISLVAERVSSNVRELEGALIRLHALNNLQNIPVTVKSAETALKALLQPRTIRISVEDIKKAVASHFSIKLSDIVSKRRTKNLSFPRHIAMYLCRKHTTASYPEIGSQFGGRDHSSVIHAANVVSTKIASDLYVKGIVEEIERLLIG